MLWGCGAGPLPGRVSAHAVPDVAHKKRGAFGLVRGYLILYPQRDFEPALLP
jgi:hypothetical protein